MELALAAPGAGAVTVAAGALAPDDATTADDLGALDGASVDATAVPPLDIALGPVPAGPPADAGLAAPTAPGAGGLRVATRVASLADPVDDARDRLIAALVLVDLVGVWLLLERRRRGEPAGDVRPRLTLHDDPAHVPPPRPRRRARDGAPPPLR
jgi:hypothetical protein